MAPKLIKREDAVKLIYAKFCDRMPILVQRWGLAIETFDRLLDQALEALKATVENPDSVRAFKLYYGLEDGKMYSAKEIAPLIRRIRPVAKRLRKKPITLSNVYTMVGVIFSRLGQKIGELLGKVDQSGHPTRPENYRQIAMQMAQSRGLERPQCICNVGMRGGVTLNVKPSAHLENCPIHYLWMADFYEALDKNRTK